MVDPKTYIESGLKIVKSLIKEGSLQSALNACQELLKVNPYHRKVQKYFKEIQERIIKQNEARVDADIESTNHLWKEGRYEDLLNIYTRLYQYAPQHAKLRKLLEKVNMQLSAQQRGDRRDFIQKATEAIAGLIMQNRFGDTIQACNELLSVDPLNKNAQKYLQNAKDGLIEQKLKENERIVESTDFERSLEFYAGLLAIDPNNTKVKRLELRAKEHFASQRMLAARIYLNESVVRMKELFKNREYEKVIQACEEILRLEPKNFSAKIFKKKAEQTITSEIEIAVMEQLKKAWATLAISYGKNPDGFVRL